MKLILAADENWAIGNKGDLLCHIPGDLKYFKERTKGKTVVMGRATLESFPGQKPLPARQNVVLTSRQDYQCPGADIVHSHQELADYMQGKDTDEVFIIGGGKVYRDFLSQCDTCYITKIYGKFPADTYFVDLDAMDEFDVVWKSELHEENGISYQFFEYRRCN